MALKLDILANTRNFVTEMKKASATTEDISDALDEMKRQGDRAGDDLEQSFRDVAKQAEKADKAVQGVGTGGFDKVKAAGSEFKSEALANFSEVTSSFDGSMSSIGDLAQGTLGGIASSIPGIGLVAGTAAVGVGLITAELTKQQEEADKTKERIASAYQSAAEEGRKYIDTAAIVADATDLMFNTERAEEWKRLQRDANDLGLDRAVIAAANAGDLDAQEVVQQRINDKIDEQKDKTEELGLLQTGEVLGGLYATRERWDSIIEATNTAVQSTKDLQDVTRELNNRDLAETEQSVSAVKSTLDSMSTTTLQVDIDTRNADYQLGLLRQRIARPVSVVVNSALGWTGQYLGP